MNLIIFLIILFVVIPLIIIYFGKYFWQCMVKVGIQQTKTLLENNPEYQKAKKELDDACRQISIEWVKINAEAPCIAQEREIIQNIAANTWRFPLTKEDFKESLYIDDAVGYRLYIKECERLRLESENKQ